MGTFYDRGVWPCSCGCRTSWHFIDTASIFSAGESEYKEYSLGIVLEGNYPLTAYFLQRSRQTAVICLEGLENELQKRVFVATMANYLWCL